MSRIKKLFLIIAFLFCISQGRAITVVAVASGNWTNVSTWSPIIPVQGDSIVIPAGITVTYNVNLHLQAGALNVYGTLNCVSDTLIIDCGGFFNVQPTGKVTGGYISVTDGANLGLVEVMNAFIYNPCSSGFTPGNFTVGVQGCGPTGLNEIESRFNLAIFPNPVFNVIRVYSPELEGTSGKISIFNVMGEEVRRQESGSLTQEIVFDVSFLSPGIYYLEFSTAKKSFRSKFIKQ